MLRFVAIAVVLLTSTAAPKANTVEEITFSRRGFVAAESGYTYCELSAVYPRLQLRDPQVSAFLNDRIEYDVMEKIGSCPEGTLLSEEGITLDEIRSCVTAEERCEVSNLSDEFVSLRCTTSWPSGPACGARPSANVRGLLYALHGGIVKRVRAEEMFVTDGAVQSVLDILEHELEVQRTESYNAISIEEVPEVAGELFQNMTITEEALEFRVMPRPGCYYEVSIPLSRVSSLVRPDYWPWKETAN